jgi:hypothetical protein
LPLVGEFMIRGRLWIRRQTNGENADAERHAEHQGYAVGAGQQRASFNLNNLP